MRKLLDRIIHADGGNNWWKPDLFIKNTFSILPRELKILKNPPKQEDNYNCFIYALGLDGDNAIKKDCGGFIYSAFFQKIIDCGLLNYTDNPQKGDYVIYRNLEKYPNVITHIGVVVGKKDVISKWSWGPLLKHRIFDVPESYGNDISFIKSVSSAKALELYEKYKNFNIKS